MTPQIKRCNACQQVKVLSDFNRHPSNRDRRQNFCRSCEAEAVPRRRHGMSRLEKAERALAQGGCLTCRTTNPGAKGWVVDHDHRCCGPVNSCELCRRGILCGRCNTALGMAQDDPALLRRLADYLDAHRARSTDRISESQDRVGPPTSIRTDGRTDVESASAEDGISC